MPEEPLVSELKPPIDRLTQCQAWLVRKQRQITFMGAFRTGKSTVLGRLLQGQELAPGRQSMPGVVTRVRHGPEPRTRVLRRESSDDVGSGPYPLGGAEAPGPELAGDIEALDVRLPSPLLTNNRVWVDTPGFDGSASALERVHQEVERSDLAVFVLDATHLLSEAEREEIRQVDSLLQGNVVFILNRMNHVPPDEREEVDRFARHFLETTGNALVGRGRTFAVTTDPDEAREDEGLMAFARWLDEHLSSSEGTWMVVASRLGILSHRLDEATSALAQDAARTTDTLQELQRSEEAAAAEARREQLEVIDEDVQTLAKARAELEAMPGSFVGVVDSVTQSVMNNDADWSQRLSDCLKGPLEAFVETVDAKTSTAMWRSGIGPPAFRLQTGDAQVTAVEDSSAVWGGVAGFIMGGWMDGGVFSAAAGAAAASWISKKFFGRDVKRESQQRIHEVALSLVPRLQEAVGNHLATIEMLLEEGRNAVLESQSPSDGVLSSLEDLVRNEETLLQWCAQLHSQVSGAQEQIPL